MDAKKTQTNCGWTHTYADGFIAERCAACEADVLSSVNGGIAENYQSRIASLLGVAPLMIVALRLCATPASLREALPAGSSREILFAFIRVSYSCPFAVCLRFLTYAVLGENDFGSGAGALDGARDLYGQCGVAVAGHCV
jgi:hypothetical protein